MIMVRRRPRQAKEPALMVVTSAGVDANGDSPLALPLNGEPISVVAATDTKNMLDDQYFASPKRKDCRLMKAHENLNAIQKSHNYYKTNNKANSNSSKSESDRIIGVQLATRSQTRTIENFFKASAAAKNKKKSSILSESELATPTIAEQKTITINGALTDELDEEDELILYDGHSVASPSTSTSSPAYQNDDLEAYHSAEAGCNYTSAAVDTHIQSDAITQTEAYTHADIHTQADPNMSPSINMVSAFQSHRSALRDSHSSSHSSSSAATSDNIFLQEPVLTLDIDRTPTKASSIRINKSFELTNAVFSSPPSALSACVLNGRFNQVVTLNGHGHGLGEELDHEQEQHQLQQPLSGFELDQHDSSSCDSGVACSLTVSTSPGVASNRRRKPATPHRILCPSPIKTMPRESALIKSEPLSPRKSPRKLQMQLAVSGGAKSRRRLNQPKPQAPYQNPSPAANEDVALEDEDEEDDVHALLKAAEERENLNKAKAMLKPAAVPVTAVKPKASTKSAKAKTTTNKAQPLAATNGNREMTDFFPVRRSVRKTKTAVKEEMMRDLEQAVLEERCDGLQVRNFTGKGRGVVAERRFKRNEFVVEYVGDLIAVSEATERERRYALDENAGCYMYYFKHKNQQYCIDATIDTGKLGRLINHSRNGNLMTKVVVVKQRPHLVLLAKDDIEVGEELTYDYGDRSKESLLHHPWLAF